MKKTGFIFALIMCCMVMVSCSGSGANDNGTEYATYKEALAANDFEAAHQLLNQAEKEMHQVYNAKGRSTFEKGFGMKSERDKLTQEFVDKYGFQPYEPALEQTRKEVINAEIQFLAVQGTDEANKRLSLLVTTEFPAKGEARSEGDLLESDAPSYMSGTDGVRYYDDNYNTFIHWCDSFNDKCMQILEMAVNLDNEQLAKMMVKTVKKDPGVISKKLKNDNYDIFAHYTTKTKDEAIAKYEEHFGKYNEQKDE